MKGARFVALVLSLFFALSSSSDFVYDNAGKPLEKNTLYLIQHTDSDTWMHGISYGRGKGNPKGPLAVVESGPEFSFGVPVKFYPTDSSDEPFITAETPLVVAFYGHFPWFTDKEPLSQANTRTSMREKIFVVTDATGQSKSFFIKNHTQQGTYNHYKFSFEGRDLGIFYDDFNGLKRLALTDEEEEP